MNITLAIRQQVRRLSVAGKSQAEIAITIGIAQSTVGYILNPNLLVHRRRVSNKWKKVVANRGKQRSYEAKRRLKDGYNARKNAYRAGRKKTDKNFLLSCNLRSRLGAAIKQGNKGGSAVSDLGCSIEFLKQYLERKFQEGMSWDNYGTWHIDHKKPLASFDLTNREQFLEACHYTNLQPLWAEENLRKQANEY